MSNEVVTEPSPGKGTMKSSQSSTRPGQEMRISLTCFGSSHSSASSLVGICRVRRVFPCFAKDARSLVGWLVVALMYSSRSSLPIKSATFIENDSCSLEEYVFRCEVSSTFLRAGNKCGGTDARKGCAASPTRSRSQHCPMRTLLEFESR